MAGKTTFFNLLTREHKETSQFYTGKTATSTEVAPIPDPRIEFLSQMYKPKKTTFATLEVTDVPGLVRGASQGEGTGNKFLAAVREADALIEVVRAFKNDRVLHVDGSVDPLRDIETLHLELLFADLQLVETRIERIKSGKKITKENEIELAAMQKCQAVLMEEKPTSQADLTEEEKAALRHIAFLSGKPMVLVVNVDEEQLAAGDYPGRAEVQAYAAERDMPVLEVCAQVEAELNDLPPEDQQAFMAELGISDSGIARLARAVYHRLGLISFLTAGEDEVRAWTIRAGISAKSAAGKIHSDIERGFIRAEVVKYDHLRELGSMAKVKEKGLAMLEGKEYIVQDGDIINFRFNV